MQDNRYIDLRIVDEIKEIYSGIEINDTDTLNDIISRIIVHIKTIEGIPKFVITRAIYEGNINGISMVRITIRPSKGYILSTKELKSVSTFIDLDNFSDEFILFVIDWLEEYIRYAKLELNIVKLNHYIEGIVNKYQLNHTFLFTLGNLIEDIDINSITIGLSEGKVKEIDKLIDFNNDYSIAEVLVQCDNVYDIFRVQSDLTYKLDIYSKKPLLKLLRGCVKKDIRNVRVGVGYMETEDKFGVIERLSVTEKELDSYTDERKFVLVEDNIKATKREIEKEKTKIVSYYRVIPFDKKI